MAELSYPDELPDPQVAPTESSERRDLTDGYGPREARAFQRDTLFTQQLQFKFTPSQATIFTAWVETTLIFGGCWFASSWSIPPGGIAVRRFVMTTQQWLFLATGHWIVRIDCEVRGRGEIPVVPDGYFTSWLYPVDSELPQIQMGGAIPVGGNLIVWPIESVKFGATFPASGDLVLVLTKYVDQLAETVKFGATLPVSGALNTILLVYTYQLAEAVKFGATFPLSGTLDVVLVSYVHQLAENVKFGATFPVSGTLV